MFSFIIFQQDKGLVTFFEDEWVSEKTQRRSSIYEVGTVIDSEFSQIKRPPPIAYGKLFHHSAISKKLVSNTFGKPKKLFWKLISLFSMPCDLCLSTSKN